jgi:PKD repeat protein
MLEYIKENLINDEEIESLGIDYDEEDLSLYKNDPDKIYFTTLGEQIDFEDISLPTIENKSQWFLDSEELSIQKIIAQNKTSFSYTFETPGIYRVSLKRGDKGSVTKFVRVIDKNSHSVSLNNGATAQNDLGASGNIGDFEVFDFSISNPKPGKWEAIVLEDISKTEEKINKRLWDFGDGTIIPTNGNKVKYSYDRAGVYEVKMCVNLTNNCKRKRIIVSESGAGVPNVIAENLERQEEEDLLAEANMQGPKTIRGIKKEENNIQKRDNFNAPSSEISSIPERTVDVVLQNVSFDLPEKVQAGLPVRIKDQSFPDEAIRSRSWYIDGEKQFFHQRTVNHIFDTPGTYEIKMCLNKKADLCMVDKINVYQQPIIEDTELEVEEAVAIQEDMKPVISYIPIVSKPTKGFMCQSYGKAGLKSKYKCTTNKEFHYGNAIVTIVANKTLELQNAEIYGDSDGYMDVFLLDDEFIEIGRIKNVQVLPGYSTIEFADLAFTLEKGKSYSILLKPKGSRKKKIGLENAATCQVPIYNNEDLTVDYQGKAYVMYDIKYCL